MVYRLGSGRTGQYLDVASEHGVKGGLPSLGYCLESERLAQWKKSKYLHQHIDWNAVFAYCGRHVRRRAVKGERAVEVGARVITTISYPQHDNNNRDHMNSYKVGGASLLVLAIVLIIAASVQLATPSRVYLETCNVTSSIAVSLPYDCASQICVDIRASISWSAPGDTLTLRADSILVAQTKNGADSTEVDNMASEWKYRSQSPCYIQYQWPHSIEPWRVCSTLGDYNDTYRKAFLAVAFYVLAVVCIVLGAIIFLR